MKIILQAFWDRTIYKGQSWLTSSIDVKIQRTVSLLYIFYFFGLLISIQSFFANYQLSNLEELQNTERYFIPFERFSSSVLSNWRVTVNSILIFNFSTALLGVIGWKRLRWIRILNFLGLLFYVVLISSFNTVYYSLFLYLLATFSLIFLPNSHQFNHQKETVLKLFLGVHLVLLAVFLSILFSFKSTFSPLFHHSIFSFFYISCCIALLSVYSFLKPQLYRILSFLLFSMSVFFLVVEGPIFILHNILLVVLLWFSPFQMKETCMNMFCVDWLKKWRIKKEQSNPSIQSDVIVFYDGDCMMCNRFLGVLASYDLPDEVKVCAQQSKTYLSVLDQYPDLKKIDSIVIIEKKEGVISLVKIKADSITWLLAKLKIRMKILRVLYCLFPLVSDVLYDFIAKNRKKNQEEGCPIPPQNIRSRIIN